MGGATAGARELGQAAEERACRYLELQGLRIVQRNVRYRCGEIDVVARAGQTWVFVEIRSRARGGDAAASIDRRKRGKIRRAAQLYLVRHFGDRWPACRFDVVLIEAGAVQWLPSAFAMNEEG
jgi:putative endonuclease